MARQANPLVTNVKENFQKINGKGGLARLKGGPDFSAMMHSHLQGIAIYRKYFIIVMNRHNENLGEIYFYTLTDNQLAGMIKIPVSDNNTKKHALSYNHPGGIQVIGDYLVIPMQTQNCDHSKIQLWDLSPLKNDNLMIQQVSEDYVPASNGEEIGGVGIVNMDGYFLVAAIDNDEVFFYSSEGMPGGDDIETATYKLVFGTTMARESSAVNLIRQSDGTVWLFAFGVSATGTSYKDWALLYKVDLANKKITDKQERHMISTSLSITIFGPHFRWGAGTYFRKGPALALLTTQRPMEPTLEINAWK